MFMNSYRYINCNFITGVKDAQLSWKKMTKIILSDDFEVLGFLSDDEEFFYTTSEIRYFIEAKERLMYVNNADFIDTRKSKIIRMKVEEYIKRFDFKEATLLYSIGGVATINAKREILHNKKRIEGLDKLYESNVKRIEILYKRRKKCRFALDEKGQRDYEIIEELITKREIKKLKIEDEISELENEISKQQKTYYQKGA